MSDAIENPHVPENDQNTAQPNKLATDETDEVMQELKKTVESLEDPQTANATLFFSELDKQLNNKEIDVAIAIVVDPECKHPHVYQRGNTYETLIVVLNMAKYLKRQLMEELQV